MEDTEGVMREWRRLDAELRPAQRRIRGAELSWQDWFFLPEPLWNDPAFWDVQWRLRGRLFPGSHPPRSGDDDDFLAPFAAKLRFHLARTRGSADAAARLRKQYPTWKAARALATRLRVQPVT
jgi:hypothetical protein